MPTTPDSLPPTTNSPARRDPTPTDPLARARTTTTRPAELARLARHRDARVRAEVAANPNASREVLMSLALTMPEIVASNAVLDWWLLEDPNWLSDVDERARQRLLASTTVRPGTRWWAARFGEDDDRSALLMSATTEPAVVAYIARLDDEDATGSSYADLAADHVSLPAAQPAPERAGENPIDVLSRSVLRADEEDVRDVLAQTTPAPWAFQAIDLTSADLRRDLARHPATPPSLLTRLLLDDDERIVALATSNPNLDRTTTDLVRRVREGAPDLSADELDAVIDSPLGIRLAAVHANLRTNVLASLAASNEWTLRRAAAASPWLTADQLVALAVDDDRDVRAAAAGNPALPLALLRTLLVDRDEMVRVAAGANIRAALVGHQNDPPTPRRELNAHVAAGRLSFVAAQPDLPLSLQRQLAAAEAWRVRHVLAGNPSTAPSVLSSLITDADLDVRRAVATHPKASSATLAALAEDVVAEIRAVSAARTRRRATLRALASDMDVDVRRGVAANPITPVSIVRALTTDPDERVRLTIAQRTSIPADTVLRLAADPADEVRLAILRRSGLSRDVLAIAFSTDLAEHTDVPIATLIDAFDAVCRGIAAPVAVDALLDHAAWIGPHLVALTTLDVAAQRALQASTNWKVRETLARRSDAEEAVLVALAVDSDYDTRAAVAANPRTPEACLGPFATDAHRLVRLRLAQREALPPSAVDVLALDEDDEVREAIARRPGPPPSSQPLIQALQRHEPLTATAIETVLESPWGRRLAAAHPSTAADQLVRLSEDTRWEVREQVGAHPATTPETLSTLSADSDRDVRRAVASNKATPVANIEALCADPDRTVARSACSNPARTETALRRSRAEALGRALRSANPASRVFALSSPEVDAIELRRRRHWASVDWRERVAIAIHPNTPSAVLDRLSNDGLHRVRAAVEQRP